MIGTDDLNSASRFVESVLNDGRLELIGELIAPNYLGHDRSRVVLTEGREGVRQLVAAWRRAFPDLEVQIEDHIREGDRVAMRWKARGTAVLPEGVRPLEWSGVSVIRVLAGKHVESWTYWDAIVGNGLSWAV
jgi:predicted SnoaL-like aldol condensation-catalyzing enzyme